MIKTGILGGDTSASGELIRILVNHPDIELVAVTSTGHCGNPLQSVHSGLVGDTDLKFSGSLNLSELDVVFLGDASLSDCFSEMVELEDKRRSQDIDTRRQLSKLIKVVDMTGYASEMKNMYFGLSEINRKEIVRHASRTYIGHPIASLALVAMGPLARHMLFSDEVRLTVEAPMDIVTEDVIGRALTQMKKEMAKLQPSFNGRISIESSVTDDNRGMRLYVRFRSAVPREEIVKIFDSVYDDHNFTFISPAGMSLGEVAGTNKCLLDIKCDGEEVEIQAIADPRMRGGAGEAVHMLNLLCGLHEKTGLALKTTV